MGPTGDFLDHAAWAATTAPVVGAPRRKATTPPPSTWIEVRYVVRPPRAEARRRVRVRCRDIVHQRVEVDDKAGRLELEAVEVRLIRAITVIRRIRARNGVYIDDTDSVSFLSSDCLGLAYDATWVFNNAGQAASAGLAGRCAAVIKDVVPDIYESQ